MPYTPFVPPHPDELTQGYFARMGHIHALVDVTGHMAYMDIRASDFRDGTDAFIGRVAELTGADRAALDRNTLKSFPDKSLSIGGHVLSRLIVRRSTIRVCCNCLAEDAAQGASDGTKSLIFRKQWLLRPVVRCPVHHVPLKEVPVPDTTRAYDLYKSLARACFDPSTYCGVDVPVPPGPLQRYVLARLDGQTGTSTWLDSQTITQAAKACEMLGCLLLDGPDADIINYTETDWARAGDAGFDLACGGAEAIVAELTRIRTTSGRTSGRAGPQAVFGKLYKWLHNTAYEEEVGSIRHVVREAILWNFPIGPGEIVFPEGFESLSAASKRVSTVSVVSWQRDGRLRNTVLLGGERRLDRLYFDVAELKALSRAERPQDVFRLSVAARMMRMNATVLRMLMSSELGKPLIERVSSVNCHGLPGGLYLKQAEIERFQAHYVTLFNLSKELAIHPNELRRCLDAKGIEPVRDPIRLQARLYRRADIGSL